LKKRLLDLTANTQALASERLASELLPHLSPYSFVLSFMSLPHEIDTFLLNENLAKQGRLLLPRVEKDLLLPYLVQDLQNDLHLGAFGILEPIPERCFPALPSVILVPALGFDLTYHRIGYGKGYYDRLLAQLPSVPTWGLGFKEQLVSCLPIEPHDMPLDHLYLI